ncbi:MAG: hypothetical protein IPP74_15515 [Alphaproteobacteria bacterium]|nr:hypothetical protein [Alphaproteobacteria bacterium]
MAKIIVKFKLRALRADILTDSDKREIGQTLVDSVKEYVGRGLSPVRGTGRFVAYKDPKKYPGDRKAKRPVNLRLTGAMMDALKYRLKGSKVELYLDPQPDYAIVHQDGSDKVPRRTFLPREKLGEKFVVSIMDEVKKIISKAVKRFANK